MTTPSNTHTTNLLKPVVMVRMVGLVVFVTFGLILAL